MATYPSQTTGLGVAAKIVVAGNVQPNPPNKPLVPGYNDVVLSISGANGPTSFQLSPQIQDVAGNEITFGTSFVLSAVAGSSPGPLTLTSVAAAVNGTAVYTGTITGGGSNAYVGQLFTIAGFDLTVNNGVFECVASSGSTLTLTNANAVLDTHAATATSEVGTAVYTGTIGVQAGSLVGQTFVVSGFVTNPSNNGTFICTANNGSTTMTLENNAAVAESHAATAVSQESNENVFVLSAAANASAGTTVYTGTIGVPANSLIGKSFTVTGFVTNAVNNGTFVVTANNGSTTITLANTAGVAESASALATGSPVSSELTYVAYGFKSSLPNTYVPSGNPNAHAVCTVSSSGVISAGVVEGGSVVEVSYPTFNNSIGDIVSSGNIMNGLPVNKIYAVVNVTVVA